MVATVCDNDPRSAPERRADAIGAWATATITCRAHAIRSIALRVKRSRPEVVVGHERVHRPSHPRRTAECAPRGRPRAKSAGTAMLSGTEAMPTPLLAELLRNGAKLRPVCTPAEEPESGYRPSAKLERFVRARDLTCRFPGCTAPAEFCDIDHVIPYPLGATHPSNLACLCRKHHHLKTFWTGDWELQLRPDGAAVWTSPTGHNYTTYPGSRCYFPDWDATTGELPPPPQPETFSTDRGLMMPHAHTPAPQTAPRASKPNANKTTRIPPTVLDEPGADAAHRLLDITRRSREGQSHE